MGQQRQTEAVWCLYEMVMNCRAALCETLPSAHSVSSILSNTVLNTVQQSVPHTVQHYATQFPAWCNTVYVQPEQMSSLTVKPALGWL